MNQPASLRSDRVAGIPWNGWPTCSGLGGRNRLDYVADFPGMRPASSPPSFCPRQQRAIDEGDGLRQPGDLGAKAEKGGDLVRCDFR